MFIVAIFVGPYHPDAYRGGNRYEFEIYSSDVDPGSLDFYLDGSNGICSPHITLHNH